LRQFVSDAIVVGVKPNRNWSVATTIIVLLFVGALKSVL